MIRAQQGGRTLRRSSDRRLEELLSSFGAAMVDTLQSLVDRPIQIHAGKAVLCSGYPIRHGSALIEGSLNGECEGRFLRFQLGLTEAITISCLMMMKPDDVIIERRNGTSLRDDELDTFHEVGNVLCSGVDSVLRDRLEGLTRLRFEKLEFVEAADSEDEAEAGTAAETDDREPRLMIAYTFKLGISSYPPAECAILVDVETAELWASRQLGSMPSVVEHAEGSAKREEFEDIPQAPILGQMACFVSDPTVLDVVQRSCRRVGLEFERHGVSEAPNPTAHKQGLVLLDVPLGQDRRFDWCKRLKHANPDVRVMLLVHHPSRGRVLQGLMAKADVILGWPLEEPVLSERLSTLLETEQ